MSGSTGQKCQQSGIYAARCCGEQIALSKNETFPPCRKWHGAVQWVLIRATSN
jgi:hypothetical protein